MNNPAAYADLLRPYVRPGDLVFDIGAHEGGHTRVLLALEARVVACEPQEVCLDQVPRGAERLLTAVGASNGDAWFYPSDRDYLSTLSLKYRDEAQKVYGGSYGEPVTVPLTTLDALIEEHGLPVFVKIDVEGYEREVLAGLSVPIPLVSFEVHEFDVEKADDCIERLYELGDYELFYSDRETFVRQDWPARIDLFGDIYAVLQ